MEKLLIVAVTPSLLEKGEFWFSENFEEIEKMQKESGLPRAESRWWRRNTKIIEQGEKISLSEFLRSVAELGYQKVWETSHKGEFSQRGGVVHIFPINSDQIYSIEFDGNYISEITPATPSSTSDVKSQKTSDVFPGTAGLFVLGDYVVHIDHGIGIFKEEVENDYMIEYAAPANRPHAPDLLFVPKKETKRLAPYLGFKKPHMSRLGTPLWNITKKKAKEDIIEFAKELLKILANRKMVERPPYYAYRIEEEELEASFMHTDTPDQKKSLAEIYHDLEKPIPMERILTGDVGFGKTEVALRAAYRVILHHKQVALIAPTTILADQHYEVFKKRLDDFGVSIGRFTRLDGKKTLKENIKKISEGKIDMAIGTHKLLGHSIQFKNLGLLIIDEEQKFGVAHKEHFKKMNPALDILTLSATPIPRTLNIALSGIQSISKIETPPEGKVEIKTYVLPKNKKIIKDAILLELGRGGQIYFLANRIHKIPKILEEIKLLKTGAKIGILHGRMGERQIIKTMRGFRNKEFNLLISTTIIENGLDISDANTLIVENATLLGLAEAHQLRGRIGRGDKEAYAYFLYPSQKLPERAAERLETLERYAWLGAGMEIAKRDLEIRGAGNILGRAQSGVAYRVGLNLYFELLEEAVAELKRIKTGSV